jgi:hypothetical protein
MDQAESEVVRAPALRAEQLQYELTPCPVRRPTFDTLVSNLPPFFFIFTQFLKLRNLLPDNLNIYNALLNVRGPGDHARLDRGCYSPQHSTQSSLARMLP